MTKNLVDEIKEKGIVKIEHFLEKEEIENITKIIR
jgi:glucose-6-phosphate 1-dehydrogenase